MCGIAGWFSRQAIAADDAGPRLDRMLDSIRHRGPDGEGQRVFNHAAIGHVRLSIIDLAGGAQPISSPDGQLTLSYNGEVYNYQALREELLALGYPFRTDSDSEVILAMYRHYGLAGFSRLRGMFAFMLWDEAEHCGLLVRDSCGIKPLFYTNWSDKLVFGSEAKAVVASGFIDGEMDLDSLHQVMNFRYITGEASMFRDILQVAPGEVLKWTPGQGLQLAGKLQPRFPAGGSYLDILDDTVRHHLVADVEVGINLSGGIDSAAILAFSKHHQPLRTFTLAIGDDEFEADNARVTADLLDAPNLCSHVDQDMDTILGKIIWHMEMPKINAAQVYLLSQVTARHVKVALSGLGGDELFYGYNAYRILLWLKWAQPGLVPFRSNHPFNGRDRSFLANSYEWNEFDRIFCLMRSQQDWPFYYGIIRNVWDCPRHREWIYGPRMLDSSPRDAFATLAERWPADNDPVTAAVRFEWEQKMVNDLLWQEDRCSMAHGLESRVPFVDTLLQQTFHALPRKQHMPRGRQKHLMKDILSPLLPASILHRGKSGFQVNSATFFQQHLSILAKRYLNEDTVKQYGLFNPAFVSFLLTLPAEKRYRWHFFMLYLMIGAHLWSEMFESPQPRVSA